jgi:hypothetical protein
MIGGGDQMYADAYHNVSGRFDFIVLLLFGKPAGLDTWMLMNEFAGSSSFIYCSCFVEF